MSKQFTCECGKQISRRAKACPHCGAPVTTTISRLSAVLRWIYYIAAGIVLLAVFHSCYRFGEVMQHIPSH